MPRVFASGPRDMKCKITRSMPGYARAFRCLCMRGKVWLHSISISFYICTGGRAYSNAYFGTGSGPIFLDDVQCSSSFNQLLQCSSSPILSNDCLHSADAGVGCEGMLCNEVTITYTLLSS